MSKKTRLKMFKDSSDLVLIIWLREEMHIIDTLALSFYSFQVFLAILEHISFVQFAINQLSPFFTTIKKLYIQFLFQLAGKGAVFLFKILLVNALQKLGFRGIVLLDPSFVAGAQEILFLVVCISCFSLYAVFKGLRHLKLEGLVASF